jgi:hypothetical protein
VSDTLRKIREMFDRANTSRYGGRFAFAVKRGGYAGYHEFRRADLPQLIAALVEIDASLPPDEERAPLPSVPRDANGIVICFPAEAA